MQASTSGRIGATGNMMCFRGAEASLFPSSLSPLPNSLLFTCVRYQSSCCIPRDPQDISVPVKAVTLDECKDKCTADGACASMQYRPDKRLCRLFTRPAVETNGASPPCDCFAREDASAGQGQRWFSADAQECLDLTLCADGEREILPPTPTSDRTCRALLALPVMLPSSDTHPSPARHGVLPCIHACTRPSMPWRRACTHARHALAPRGVSGCGLIRGVAGTLGDH